MTIVEYTEEYFVSSSAVDGLYFNENDNTLVIDWDDSLYRYSGVTKDEANAVANGTYQKGFWDRASVGRAAQALKVAKGQGEYLGEYDDLWLTQVDVRRAVGVPKDLTYNVTVNNNVDHTVRVATESVDATIATKEYSLGEPVSSGFATNTSQPTKEYSLGADIDVDDDGLDDDADVVDVTVFFTLEGSDTEHEFEAESEDVYDAVEELNEFIARLRTKGRVTKVVVTFD